MILFLLETFTTVSPLLPSPNDSIQFSQVLFLVHQLRARIPNPSYCFPHVT